MVGQVDIHNRREGEITATAGLFIVHGARKEGPGRAEKQYRASEIEPFLIFSARK